MTWNHPSMSQTQFNKRMAEIAAEEALQPEVWQWLSYASDDGFRGVIVTRARGIQEAILKAHRLKISPGGEVCSNAFPQYLSDKTEALLLEHSDRLLDEQTALQLNELLVEL